VKQSKVISPFRLDTKLARESDELQHTTLKETKEQAIFQPTNLTTGKSDVIQTKLDTKLGIIQTELVASFRPTGFTNDTDVLQQAAMKETKEQVNFRPTTKELQQCRLDLEKWLSPKIDEWVGTSMPLLDWVWEMEENNKNGTTEQYYLTMFLATHTKDKSFRNTIWYCLDEFGNSREAVVLDMGGEVNSFQRIYIRCDLEAASNRANTTSFSPVALMPAEVPPLSDHKEAAEAPNYDLRPFLKCDRLEQRNPPPPHVKVGGCVKVRGMHKYLRQWIEHHRLIGMQHFWIYLNEPFDIHDLPNVSDVTYIPYNYVWRDHLANARYKAPFNGENFWQTTAQNQCLYMTKRYGLDWITTTDVDEYIWITDPDAMNSTDPPPVQAFLSQFSDKPDLGALKMNSLPFGRNKKVEPKSKEFELIVDYTCRQKKSPSINAREKNFFGSQVALDISVHQLRNGGNTLKLEMASQARLNHYKQPWKGPFQAKKLPANELMNDTSLPDKYRKSILQGLDSYRANITGIG
jgi:hypothetical protein